MLKITRNENQSFQIGENITVTIEEINGKQARISIDAPPEVKILRDDAIKKEKCEPTILAASGGDRISARE